MRVVFLALVLLVLSSLTFAAEPHRLAFYADRNATSCDLATNYPGFLEVHVMLEGGGDIVTVTFGALKPQCMRSAVWIADAWDWDGGTVLQGPGTTQDPDGTVVVMQCHPAPIYVGRIMYLLTEPTDPCCRYEPTPSRAAGPPYKIEVVVTVGNICNPTPGQPAYTYFEEATSKGVIMNSNETCSCDLPLPVQQSTWG